MTCAELFDSETNHRTGLEGGQTANPNLIRRGSLKPIIERVSVRSAQHVPDHSKVPGVVIDYSPAKLGKYVGSPSLVVLPDGTYVASHDFFGPRTTCRYKAESVVFKTENRGKVWTKIAELNGLFWGKLFISRNRLYVLGTICEYGTVVIRRSLDGGKTWSVPLDSKSSRLTDKDQHHCAPVPVIVHNGRIWRSMEDKSKVTGDWGGKYLRAGVVSAPVDADLLDAKSWTFSKRIAGDPTWLDSRFKAWLEGNVVAAPDGDIVCVMRVDTAQGGKAAIINVSPDGRNLSFNPRSGFIDFPGGAKKFTIRYDERTQLYWSLVSYVQPKDQGKAEASMIRNTLALTSSPNLEDWTVRSVVLYHPDVRKTGFQYADWHFEGNDIIAESLQSPCHVIPYDVCL